MFSASRRTTVADWRTDFFCEHLMLHEDIPRWEGVRGERYAYARYLLPSAAIALVMGVAVHWLFTSLLYVDLP